MFQWLAGRGGWQYFVIMWPIAATCGLAGVMTASWSGLAPHTQLTAAIESVAPGSLFVTAGATFGRWLKHMTPPKDHAGAHREGA